MTRRQQKSIRYYTDELPRGFDEFYTGMFIDDVADGLMPVGGEARVRNFSVRLEPPDDRLEEMLVTGLTSHEPSDSLADALCELFRLTAHEVCARDYAAYEIVYYDTDDQTVSGFDLAYIPAQRITIRRNYIRQELPRPYASERGYPSCVELARSDVVLFHAPKGLQSKIRRTRNSLSRLKDERLVPLVLEAQQSNLPYDFKIHQSALNVALADALKEIGWTARGLFNDRMLSYSLVYMHLLFERFKSRLREAFLQQLNDGLHQIGKVVGSSSYIEVVGLPTADEINAAFVELLSGKKAFTQIMEPFLRY
jgi:hypothetical protein